MFCAALLGGCEQPSAAPTALAPAAPASDFANGPANSGLNVIRFSDSTGGFFIVDPKKLDFLVVEGLPTDPHTLFLCAGGTSLASTLDYQMVEWIRGVVHNHVLGQDVNVHVYRFSDLDQFGGDLLALFCQGTPLAAGTGRASIEDNDVFGVSGKTRSSTFTIDGWVTDLRTGALLHVTARSHGLVDFRSDPPHLTLDYNRVELRPVGAP